MIGYARVSTNDQNFDLQTEALSNAGCSKIFDDKISVSRAERLGLYKAMEQLREGDTLVVWKLYRLGRSVKNLVDLVTLLHKQGFQYRSLTEPLNTGTPSGRFFFHVMASLAEMERELTVERTRRTSASAPTRARGWSHAPNDRQQNQASEETKREYLHATLPRASACPY